MADISRFPAEEFPDDLELLVHSGGRRPNLSVRSQAALFGAARLAKRIKALRLLQKGLKRQEERLTKELQKLIPGTLAGFSLVDEVEVERIQKTRAVNVTLWRLIVWLNLKDREPDDLADFFPEGAQELEEIVISLKGRSVDAAFLFQLAGELSGRLGDPSGELVTCRFKRGSKVAREIEGRTHSHQELHVTIGSGEGPIEDFDDLPPAVQALARPTN